MTESLKKAVVTAGSKQNLVRKLLCTVVAMAVMLPATLLPALAQAAPAAPSSPSGGSSSTTSSRNLDLSSTDRSITSRVSGTITRNGTTVNITQGDLVTPAENVALYQLLRTGTQSILLGDLGRAIGGSFNVTAAAGHAQVSNVVIPTGVTGLGNFSANNALNVTGNLSNLGNLYLYSTSANSTAANVSAQNIYNNRTGLISTALPTNFSQLYGITSPIAKLNLNLSAINNIVNSGRIISSGNLNLLAGNSIINALPAGVTGAHPVMQAAQNLNLISNQIINSGVMQAIQGNLNISGLTNGALSVDSRGGTMQALMGSINVRDSLFNSKANFDLLGGRLLSKEVNIFSGNGIARLQADEISGLLNIKAGEAHVLVNSDNLRIGNIDLSGDPTFFNSSGDVTVSGNLNFTGAALAIVAKGSIISSGGNWSLTTSDGAGDGKAINLIAGVNFTPTGNIQPPVGDTVTTLTITGGSTTGGRIDLSGTPILALNSSGGGAAGNGGNINMIAYAGTAANSGKIILPITVDINASGAGTGANGNINIIGGSATGIAVTTGGITSTGGSGGGGNVTVAAATPVITGAANVQITDGAITNAGSWIPGTLQTGGISIGSSGHNTNIAGNFTANTNGGIATTNVTAGGNINMSAGSVGLIAGALSANNITLTAKGNITTTGLITATNNVNFSTTANNGSISFQRNVVAGNAVTMSANGSGSILGLNQAITTFGANVGLNPGGFQFLLGGATHAGLNRMFVPDFTLGIVAVIDTTTNTHIANISLGGSSQPEGVVISPDGTKLYVAESGDRVVSVWDTTTFASQGTINIGGLPTDPKPEVIAVSPDGAFLYILSSAGGFGTGGASTFKVADTGTLAVTQTINLQNNMAQSGGIVVNPQGTRAYVTNSGSFGNTVSSQQSSKSVFVIDITGGGTGNSIQQTISLGTTVGALSPYALALDPTGTKLYVGNCFSDAPLGGNGNIDGNILVIDIAPSSVNFNKVTNIVALPQSNANFVGTFPQGIAVSPTGNELFVQSTYFNGMSSVYTATNSVIEFVNTGQGPDGFGSNSFSTILSSGGVPTLSTYTQNTINLSGPNTITLVQKPTIQAQTISLSSGTGSIIADYAHPSPNGTITANTGGTNGVVLANVGSNSTNVGNSSAGGIFQLGSIGSVNVTGNITASNLSIMATGTTSTINIGGTIGKTGGTVSLSTLNGDITTNNPNSAFPQGTQTLLGAGATNTLGTELYLPNVSGQSLDLIDTTTNLPIIPPIALNAIPGMAVATGNGNSIYVTATGGVSSINAVLFIDRTMANAITQINIPTASGVPQAVTLSPNGTRLYVLTSTGSTNTAGANKLVVINTATNAIIATVTLNANGFSKTGSVAVNAAGTVAYVANSGSKTVSIVNLTNNTVTGSVSVSSIAGQNPFYLSYDSGTQRVNIVGTPNATTSGAALGSVGVIDANSASANFNKLISSGAAIIGTSARIQTVGGNIGFSGTLPVLPADPTGPTVPVTVPLITSVGTLGVSNQTGNTIINNNGILTLTGAVAGTGDFTLSNVGSITLSSTGTFTGDNISINTNPSSNGSITINAQLGTPATTSVFVSADGSGNIMQAAGAFNVRAATITLNSGFGNIGTAGTPIRTQTSNLSSTSLGFLVGSTFLNNTGVVNLGASSAGNTFQLVNSSSINIVGLVTNASIQTFIAQSGNIDVGANVGVTDLGTTTTLTAAGAITNNLGLAGGIVRGFNVKLTASNGDVGAPTNSFADMLATSALNLNVTAPNGSAYISAFDFAPYNINVGASTVQNGGIFQMFADGQITVTGAINADIVDLETYQGAFQGNIIVGANIGRTGVGSTTLVVDGGNSIKQTAGTILSPAVILGSQFGDVGTSIQPIKTQATTLFGGTGGVGNFFLSNNSANLQIIDQTADASPGGVSAGKTLSIINTGNINITGQNDGTPVIGAQVILQAGLNKNIAIGDLITGTQLNQVALGGTLSGNSIGNNIAVTFNNPNIPGATPGTKQITYVIASGNSFSDIATGLVALINADTDLQAAGISSTAFGGAVAFSTTGAAGPTSYSTSVTQGTGTGNPTAKLTFSSTASSATLTAGGTGTLTVTGSGAVNANAVTLQSTSGAIGALATRIPVGGVNLNLTTAFNPTVTAKTTGAANIFLNTTTTETLTGSSASTVTGIINVLGASNVNVGGTNTASTFIIDATGNIAGTGTLMGTNAILNSTGGNIGSSTSARLNTQVANLHITTTGANVFVKNTGAVTLTTTPTANTAASIFDLQATSNILGAGTIIIAPSVVLSSTGGTVGTSATHLQVDTTGLAGSSATTFFVDNVNTGTLNVGATSAGSTLQISTPGNISTSGVVTAPVAINLFTSANNGNIDIGANLGALSTAVRFDANGSGNITLNTGTLRSSTLRANTTTGDITLTNTGTTNIIGATGDAIVIQANGGSALNVNGTVTGTTVTLRTDAVSTGVKNITIGANITGTTSVVLQAGQNGNITQNNPALLVVGSSITMQSDVSGSVGMIGAPIRTVSGTLNLRAPGTLSTVNVSNTGPVTLTGNGATANTANNFTLTNAGSITLDNSVQVIGLTSLTLTSNGAPANISQLDATGTTTLFSPTIVLTAGSTTGTIGNVNTITVARSTSAAATPQTVNLTANAGSNVDVRGESSLATGLVSLNFTGASSAGTPSGTGVFTASAEGNISLAAGASIKGFNIALDGSTGITQVAGTTLTAPTISLSSGGAIGTQLAPIGINSGIASPVALTVTAIGNSFVAVNTVGLNVGNVNLSTSSAANFTLTALGNINVAAAATVSATGTLTLTTSGANCDITQGDATGTPTLFAPNMVLNATVAGGANIGSPGTNLTIGQAVGNLGAQTVNLTANAGGGVYINGANPPTGAVTINLVGNSTAMSGSEAFKLLATGDITFASTAKITATDFISLQTTDFISQAGSATTLFAPSVELVSGTANVGSLANPMRLSSGATVFGIAAADAFVTGAGPLTVGDLNAGNNLVITATSIAFVGSTSSVTTTLNASGNITQVGNGPTQTATTSFTSNSGQFGTNARFINTDSPSIFFNTGSAAIYVSNATSTTLQNNFTGGIFRANTLNGNLTINGNITAPTIDLFANGASANLTLNGNIGQAGATVRMSAGANISQTSGALNITAATLNLQTNTGSIGTVGQFLNTTAGTIAQGAVGAGSMFVSNNGNVTLNSLGLGGTFADARLTASGNITISGALNTIAATLTSTTATGNITVNNTVGDGTSTVTAALTSVGGTGSITTSGTGVLRGTVITLNSQNGNVGTAGAPVKTQATNLAGGTLNGEFAVSNNSGSLTINGLLVGTTPTQNDNNLTVITNGNLAVTGITNVVGGSALLQSTNTGATITFANSAQLTTLDNVAGQANGQIRVVIGATAPTTGATLAPISGVTLTPIGTGQILVGTGSNATPVSLVSGTATITAKNTNVIFSIPVSAAAGSIILNDQVVITGDPPAASPSTAPIQPVAALFASAPLETKTNATTLQPPAVAVQTSTTAATTLPSYSSTTTTARDTMPTAVPAANNNAWNAIEHATLNDATSFNGTNIRLFDESDNASTTALPIAHVSGAPILSGSVSSSAKSGTHSYVLNHGGMLFAPAHSMVVQTPFGNLHVGANAVVLAIVTKDGVAMYNLHDDHRGDVHFQKLGTSQEMELHLSQHILLSRSSDAAYEDLNPLASVTHRDLETHALPGGMTMHTTHFSILSAVGNVLPLISMQQSSNPRHRKIVNRLLKDAAILMQTRAASGAYRKLSNHTDTNASPAYTTAQK